jgi:hypothetical protein
MNFFKLLAAGTAAGIIMTAFRNDHGQWIVPGRGLSAPSGAVDREREPVLGYDGLDDEALQDWLDTAVTDRAQLLRMIRYEAGHRGRQPVLSALVDQL